MKKKKDADRKPDTKEDNKRREMLVSPVKKSVDLVGKAMEDILDRQKDELINDTDELDISEVHVEEIEEVAWKKQFSEKVHSSY